MSPVFGASNVEALQAGSLTSRGNRSSAGSSRLVDAFGCPDDQNRPRVRWSQRLWRLLRRVDVCFAMFAWGRGPARNKHRANSD